jgi:hypothetical protein
LKIIRLTGKNPHFQPLEYDFGAKKQSLGHINGWIPLTGPYPKNIISTPRLTILIK